MDKQRKQQSTEESRLLGLERTVEKLVTRVKNALGEDHYLLRPVLQNGIQFRYTTNTDLDNDAQITDKSACRNYKNLFFTQENGFVIISTGDSNVMLTIMTYTDGDPTLEPNNNTRKGFLEDKDKGKFCVCIVLHMKRRVEEKDVKKIIDKTKWDPSEYFNEVHIIGWDNGQNEITSDVRKHNLFINMLRAAQKLEKETLTNTVRPVLQRKCESLGDKTKKYWLHTQFSNRLNWSSEKDAQKDTSRFILLVVWVSGIEDIKLSDDATSIITNAAVFDKIVILIIYSIADLELPSDLKTNNKTLYTFRITNARLAYEFDPKLEPTRADMDEMRLILYQASLGYLGTTKPYVVNTINALCGVCNAPARVECNSCGKKKYCGTECQKLDQGEHQNACCSSDNE